MNTDLSLSLFNDVPLDTWKKVLNDNMDYHFRENILNREIFENVHTVLDVGCGWGGTLRDIKRLYNIEATGLTNSPQQYEYIGHDVILADANTWESKRRWDLITFIQSFTHMRDEALILRSYNTNKIFISDFYIEDENSYFVPDWVMEIRTREKYEKLISQIGFEIKSFKTFPHSEYKKNAEFWLNNIQQNKVTNGWQINVLERFCKSVLLGRHDNFKMCDIYAERK
jgi:cyclopropane fatty-acyl-phospholipid synthase-like methyltransferase